MHSKNDQPRFKWKEHKYLGPTEKRRWRLLRLWQGVYVHTPISAEWFPRLNMWRAVERVSHRTKKGERRDVPHYRAEFPCEPELRDFVLASCMEFLEAYYVLKNGDT
jgi:hypothetical protein